MGKIYSNAWVTIVGLNSGSCARGFLNGRWSASALAPQSVDFREGDDDGDSDEELLGQEETEVTDLSTWKFASAMSKARWSSRGWTFQEKALSTRLVYFDSLNVHLRCANFTFREGKRGPLLGRQLAFLEPGGQGDTEIVQSQTGGSGAENLREELLELWRNIFIPRFATCEFSRAADNLPAILGLARYVGEVSGYRYAAGLWVEDLWREVVWYGRSARSKSVPSGQGGFADLMTWLDDRTEYIAPSWSWAREGGGMARLDFLDLSTRIGAQGGEVEVLAMFEVKAVLKGLNPYGQVTYGELVITSKILPLLAGEYAKGNSDFELDWDVEAGGGLPDGLDMVLIGRYRATERVWPDFVHVERSRVYGLVVYPSPVVMGKYYRVGIFSRPVSSEGWMDFGAARTERIVIV